MLPISLRVKSKVLSMAHKPFPGLQTPHLPELTSYQFSPWSLCCSHTAVLPLLWTNHLHASLFSSWFPQVYTQMIWYQRGFSSSIKINPSHIVLLFLAPNIIWHIIYFIYLLIVSVFISRIQGSRNLVLLMPWAWHSTIFANMQHVTYSGPPQLQDTESGQMNTYLHLLTPSVGA